MALPCSWKLLSDPSDIIRELTTLRKRIGEIMVRIRRGVDLLTDVYQELGNLVVGVAAPPWRAPSAAPAAPAVQSIVESLD